jgi:hypothetical protein
MQRREFASLDSFRQGIWSCLGRYHAGLHGKHILCWFRVRDPLAWPMAPIEEYDDGSVLGMACSFGFGGCGFLGVDCGGAYLVSL